MEMVIANKKIGIMQPYFFPYIGYWQLLNAVDEYIIFDDVNYIKSGWINRNNILYNRAVKRINLYIRDASQNRLIKDTHLAENNNTEKLIRLIKDAYRKAPYFNETFNLLERLLRCNNDNLSDFLKYQIEAICEYLEITTKIYLSSNLEKNRSLKGEEKIIDICINRGADCYINAIGGKELYHKEIFERYGIKLLFLRNICSSYKQFENLFVPDLSIIDVMMFNSVEEIQQLLTEFKLENA